MYSYVPSKHYITNGTCYGWEINYSSGNAFSYNPFRDQTSSSFLRRPPNHFSSLVHDFIQVNGVKTINNPFSSNISLHYSIQIDGSGNRSTRLAPTIKLNFWPLTYEYEFCFKESPTKHYIFYFILLSNIYMNAGSKS